MTPLAHGCATRPRPGRRAFTLVEMLMVILVIGIVSAVTMPMLAKSIRGNRLRMSARSVVSAGRFARSMAVMQQHEMELRLDLESGKFTVEPSATGTRAGTGTTPVPPPGRNTVPEPPPLAIEGEEPPPVTIQAGAMDRMVRALDNVKFDYVETGEGMRKRTKGTVSIIYLTNGRCSPYRVRLVDDDGAATLISVDPLGAAESKRE